MNTPVTAATLDAVDAPPVRRLPAPAGTAPRSWLRLGIAHRAGGALAAAGGLWLLVLWALATPGVA